MVRCLLRAAQQQATRGMLARKSSQGLPERATVKLKKIRRMRQYTCCPKTNTLFIINTVRISTSRRTSERYMESRDHNQIILLCSTRRGELEKGPENIIAYHSDENRDGTGRDKFFFFGGEKSDNGTRRDGKIKS